MANLQVKSLDDDLYRALRARAKLENRTVSQEVVKLIQNHLAHPAQSSEETTKAFLELAGAWQDDRSARELSADLRRARHRRKGRMTP